MLSYLLSAIVTPFPRTFIIKVNANNGRIQQSCPFPALMTPFAVTAFINEEATVCINGETIGAINEAAIGAIIAGRNPTGFFILCFTVLLVPSVNRPEISSDSMI